MKMRVLVAVTVPLAVFIALSPARADTTELILNQYQYATGSSNPTIVTDLYTSPQYYFRAGTHYGGDFFLYADDSPLGGVAGSADFDAPNGLPLKVGTYTGATRWPLNPPGAPGFDYTIFSSGPNTVYGQFTVLEAVYDSSGSMQHFGATFEDVSPVDGTVFETGTVYYNFDLPISAPEPSPITLGAISLAALLYFARFKKFKS